MNHSAKAYFVALLLLSGVVTPQAAQTADAEGKKAAGEWRAANAAFDLDTAQLSALQQKAIMGDGKAAMRISRYYRFGKMDGAEADLWSSIAIENGDTEAMYAWARNAMRSKQALARLRAKYWFEKLRNNQEYGSRAKGSLSEMDMDDNEGK